MSTANRMWGLDAPKMRIDAAHLVFGGEGTVDIPLPAHVIEHERGLVLFDTGMNPVVNEDPRLLFGDRPEAPYLANTLAAKGALLTQYHGTGHFSLGNYITMISGQSEPVRW